jgi:hypothetical protein
MDAMIDNATITKNSAEISQRIFSTDLAKFLFLSFVIITLFWNIFTLVGIILTRLIPFAAKLLICITLLGNSSFLVTCILAYVIGFLKEIPGAVSSEVVRVSAVVSWLAVTILSLERVFCLYYPYLYSRKADERNITKFVVVCISFVVCIKLSLRYLVIPTIKQEGLDFIKATKSPDLTTYFLAVFIFINSVCYIATFFVVRKHVRAIEGIHTLANQSTYRRRHFTSTGNIVCIIAVFQLVHVPLLISFCVLSFKEDGARNTNVSAVCMLIMCAVYPALYAWRFRECRYVMLKVLSKLFPMLNQRIEPMRLEVYNIEDRNARRE